MKDPPFFFIKLNLQFFHSLIFLQYRKKICLVHTKHPKDSELLNFLLNFWDLKVVAEPSLVQTNFTYLL